MSKDIGLLQLRLSQLLSGGKDKTNEAMTNSSIKVKAVERPI